LRFEGQYKIQRHGYDITNRLCYFNVDLDAIEADMSDDDLESIFYSLIDDDFDYTVRPFANNVAEFIKFAKDNNLVENDVG
jgi:hypothetical protein